MSPLRINREHFLLLAAALASARCSEPRPPAKVGGNPPAPAAIEVSEPEPEAEPEPEVEASAATAACDSRSGQVECANIARHEVGPTCEGLRGACELLGRGYGYTPRVAAAISKCWERLGSRACSINARRACNREGIRHACRSPEFEGHCRAALDRCRAAGARPDYTTEECVLALSSLEGGNLEWAKSAMGPSSEGKCELAFPVY